MVLAQSDIEERVAGDTVRFPSAPSLDFILGLKKDYETYYGPFHSACRKADDYYFGRNVVAAPKNTDIIKPATARNIVNVATDHVDVNNVAIDVPLASAGAKARAERIKGFYLGAWLSIKKPVKRTMVHHAFRYGIGWVKQMWATELWPDGPKIANFGNPNSPADFNEEGYRKALREWRDRRRIAFPFQAFNVNPQNLLWDDSRTGAKWAIETHSGLVKDIRRKYPEWKTNKSDNQIASWTEYWDDTYYAYLADDNWVQRPTEHGYGFQPFTPVISGQTGDYEWGPPVERYQGLLFSQVYNLLDAEARLMTQYEAIVRKYAWKTLDITGPNKQAVDEVAAAYEIFGGVNALLPGVEVKPSPDLTPPQEILRILEIIQNAIEEATFPNVVRGVRPKGVSSGFAISVLAGTGRLVFQGVADGASRAIEQINSNNAKLVENKARATVTVHARSDVHSFDQSIGPDDIKGYYENFVTLKAEAPEESERESLLAMRLHQVGIISKYRAMQRAGVANPLEEMNQIAAEQFLEGLRPQQLEQIIARLAGQEAAGRGQAAEPLPGGGENIGNQFLPGQSQGPRPGERNIQQARVASQQGRESVFPQGLGGLDLLAQRLGSATGGGQGVPSGQRVP